MKLLGKILIRVGMAFAFLLYSQLAGAQTWTASGPTNLTNGGSWWAVTCSADGRIIAAAGYNALYISTNYGRSWVSNNISAGRDWVAIASSADGTHLAAVSDNLYTSTNMGVTWKSNFGFSISSGGGYGYGSVACSADGSKLAWVGGGIYFSTNGGNSWVSNTTTVSNLYVVAMSADGRSIAAAGFPSVLFVSTNLGQNWVRRNGPTNLTLQPRVLAASADCTRLQMVNIVSFYTSTNAGGTWWSNNPAPPVHLFSVASAADGQHLVTVCHGHVYTANAGFNWVSNNVPTTSVYSLASSADGTRLVAAGSGIWTSYTPAASEVDIALINNTAKISWLIPGANFALEQNSDPQSTNWSIVSTIPDINTTNLHYEVNVPMSGTSAYYRLHFSQAK